MKRIALLIVLLFGPFVTAYCQIPNSGFENWTNMGSYSNPDGWGTLNNLTSLAGVYTATKGTPGSPGTAYLKLTSLTVGTSVVNGIAVSGQLDSITMQPISGFALASRPANLTGKWQHMIYGTSQGSIQVLLTRWDAMAGARTNVGTGSVTLSGMAMSWAAFTIPITYTDGNDPDSCIIILKASGSAPTVNDYLWVDNLAFTGTVTGISTPNASFSNLSIYPNPMSGSAMVSFFTKASQHAVIEIKDLSAKTVYREDLGSIEGNVDHELHLSQLAKGYYLLGITGDHGTEYKKLVIE